MSKIDFRHFSIIVQVFDIKRLSPCSLMPPKKFINDYSYFSEYPFCELLQLYFILNPLALAAFAYQRPLALTIRSWVS